MNDWLQVTEIVLCTFHLFVLQISHSLPSLSVISQLYTFGAAFFFIFSFMFYFHLFYIRVGQCIFLLAIVQLPMLGLPFCRLLGVTPAKHWLSV